MSLNSNSGKWITCTLGDIVTFKRGYDLPKDKMNKGDYPVVGSNGIIGYHDEFTTESPGITIGRSGNVGNPFIVKKASWSHNTTLFVEKFKNVDPYFVYYYLKTIDLKQFAGGSAVPTLNRNHIHPIDIRIPEDIIEQKKISTVLLTIDEKISVLHKINNNLERIAKSIYRYHFIEFVPYSQDNFKSTAIGKIPETWSVQSIGNFVDDMKNGGTPKRGESDYWENGTVPWLKTGEINNNIIIKSEEHITELGLKNSSAKLLPINSIIMALYGKGTAARIGLLKFEATTNQACCAMICNDFNKTLFLYLFLLFNQKEIENLASGSVQQNLSKDLIANLELAVPPIEIIENLPFKEIFDTLANNYFEIEYLTNLRDTLLPKLMSGEINVSKINYDLKNMITNFNIISSKLFNRGINYEN